MGCACDVVTISGEALADVLNAAQQSEVLNDAGARDRK